jgi:hypothetical protein
MHPDFVRSQRISLKNIIYESLNEKNIDFFIHVIDFMFHYNKTISNLMSIPRKLSYHADRGFFKRDLCMI